MDANDPEGLPKAIFWPLTRNATSDAAGTPSSPPFQHMARVQVAPAPQEETKTVASLLREAIAGGGFKDVKECARSIRVPYDLFNKVLGGHLPKDAQLAEYARKLGVDERELILAAYREKAPDAVKPSFNAIVLLDQHPADLRELLDLVDTSTAAQREELLEVARLLRGKPSERCLRALALLRLYHHLDSELADYFDSMVLMSLRRESLPQLDDYRAATGTPPSKRGAPVHGAAPVRSVKRSPRSGGKR